MTELVLNDLDDATFCETVASALAAIPGVEAVMLGGSRASGTNAPDADWDFSIYYRSRFDVAGVRALGWDGEVSPIGGWGGGVFNGGAWLTVGGRKVDVHYRDLVDVERRVREAERGEFAIEHLLFYLAGVPTYVVVAELALGRVVRGELPSPAYPEVLRRTASKQWQDRAELTLWYATGAYAGRGDVVGTVGSATRALMEAGHARLAARGAWITNEKALIARAGLGDTGRLFQDLHTDADSLRTLLERVGAMISEGR